MTTTTAAEPGPRLEEITRSNIDAAMGIQVRPDQEFAVPPS